MSDIKSIHHSYWQQANIPDWVPLEQRYPTLDEDLSVDVAIIGGGITGLSTALELLARGMKVAVLEASVIGAGTTGGSSGHVDADPEMGPHALLKRLGTDKAQQYIGLRQTAIRSIESRSGGQAHFKRVPAYYYSEYAEDRDEMRSEFEAAARIGLDVEWLEQSLPLPYAACGYRMENFGRMHCLGYLKRLAEIVTEAGGKIFEGTFIKPSFDSNDRTLRADSGSVAFNQLVTAVHFNMTPPLRIDAQIPPHQSYVIAARVSNPPEDALYWDNGSPYFYTRHASDDDPGVLLIGGCDHHTGDGDPLKAMQKLEDYVYRRYQVENIISRWSAELFEPVDGLPIIGKVPGHDYIWIATGLSGVGLTWGTAAGWLIADQIQGRRTPLQDELSPARFGLNGLKNLATEHVAAARSYSERILPADEIDPDSLYPGEGKVGKVDGEFVAICRDRQGCEHRSSPICTHKGGVVHWNAAEQTWDCPVHGGRFNACGKRLYGPPSTDLEQKNPAGSAQ
ncbi:FAD-dependent oxidoreductase [Rubinisphaera margarita]|uniref:FAD-dependent oxidoreductase n=1 Tax=Rubinisphaera margarita TaxID=2909586 RepID=UPI001EE786AB|nr:FAD-dependent oxidoreductase [Rubinisphaera margarita]MCG6157592.1 FAD-dependent oxidoreductase [Rubinisphaera margarita]